MTTPEAPHVTSGERIERTIDVQGIQTHLFEAGSPAALSARYLSGKSLARLSYCPVAALPYFRARYARLRPDRAPGLDAQYGRLYPVFPRSDRYIGIREASYRRALARRLDGGGDCRLVPRTGWQARAG